MFRWSSAKKKVIAQLIDDYLALYPRGRTILGCDTAYGAAGGAFADDLAQEFTHRSVAVFRASLEDFFAPAAIRYLMGRDSSRGYYEYAYDESLLRRVLIGPFKLGGSTGFVCEGFDKQRDQPYESRWITAPADAVLIVDGPFLNRPTLRGVWNQSLWLFSDRVSVGDSPSAIRNAAADTLYRQRVRPISYAAAAVDLSDSDHPVRVFHDFC
ncbi:hypothetical protein [Lysinibacter sp. HNR]|uniref:hypothetical protein n=1 Tax=Lysinibacter sp. HNR TaxID=3031408 RepID=UPI0024353F44|nr:hypothetical protein [Lysinibacter sp. HNR]WGD36696.1 hypothetical protein FrondiHNR_09530 [Lysinibacter sp. HNR]